MPHVRSSRPEGALVLLACLLGCAACDEPPAPALEVTDSAGVTLTVASDDALVYAALDSAPALSIGGASAEGATQFFRIQNIKVDRRGRLWVADGQSGELRLFDAAGSHWKTRGGRGEGPGEFLQIRLLGATAGDTVLVGDRGTDRVTVFDPEGELVRSQILPSSDRPAPLPFDVFGDGSVLGQVPRVLSASSLEPGRVLTDSVELVRVRAGSDSVSPYAAASGPLWLWTGRTLVPIPFTINASFVVVGEAVHVASGPDFRIRVFQGGRVVASYGVDRPRRAVTAPDLEAYRAFVDEYVPEPRRPENLAALDHDRRPGVLPAYDRLLAAPEGHVWAQVYESDLSAAHRWDVFDGSRAFVGGVHVPAGFYPHAVAGGALVGVWRDGMGVEHVRSYRLVTR